MEDAIIKNKPERLYFIDNIRVFLTIMVVMFHFAIIYQGKVFFFYSEPSEDTLSNMLLAAFKMFNQIYFMGLFFFISGYFTPGSVKRKGAFNFIKERTINFSIPILLYIFILGPFTMIAMSNLPVRWTDITATVTYSQYFTDKTYETIWLGQIWFIIMLLLYNTIYALFHELRKKSEHNPVNNKLPKFITIVLFTLCIAIGCYVVMIFIPTPNTVVGFPSLFFLPQYIAFFAAGTMAGRGDWLRKIPDKYGIIGLITVVISTAILLPVFIGTAILQVPFIIGHGTFSSAVFALWSNIYAVGFSLFLIVCFRKLFNYQNKFTKFLQAQSFGVYVFHASIISFVAILLHRITVNHFVKFLFASLIGVSLSYIISWVIRKIPYANKVL